MKTFKEFMMQMMTKESTAAKRNKIASLLGLMPPIPDASINAGATADPRYVDYYKKHVKGKKHKKHKKKLDEGRTIAPVHHEVDAWLDAVDKLKKDLDHQKPEDDDKYISPDELADDGDDEVGPDDPDQGFDDDQEDEPEEMDDEPEPIDEPEDDDDPSHPLNQHLDRFLGNMGRVPPTPDGK